MCSCSSSVVVVVVVVVAVYLSIHLSIYLQAWKRSYPARLPQLLNLTTSKTHFLNFRSWQRQKTKQFCETSSIFEVDNIKNETFLRDFLQKWRIVECRADGLVPMRFVVSPLHLSKVITAPATKKWGQVIRSVAPVTQNHLSKPEDLMHQNATHRGKSAPWPPNISDEHFSCTAPATRSASLQILFKCPTPALPATKPSHFANF